MGLRARLPAALLPVALAAGCSAPDDSAQLHGKTVFEGTCIACHGQGIGGAPRVGSKKMWGPRVTKGVPVLEQHALQGYSGTSGQMPARGGNPALSDEDVKAAVAWMVGQVRS